MSFSTAYNVVTQFAAFPCADPSPIIIAATFAPAVAPALLEWVTFGCRDLLKFKLGKGVPCGRAMRGNVAKVIPPTWFDGTSGLMKFESIASRIGQALLFADLATDTLARWTTLAYQMSGCPDALEGSFWKIEFSSPGALRPGIPTPVGGTIVDFKGTHMYANSNGGVCPADWWFQAEFSCTAVPFHPDQSCDLKTWLSVSSGSTFDFPAHVYSQGYAGQSRTGHYMAKHHNGSGHGPQLFTFMAESNTLAVTTDVTATCSVTPYEPSKWALSPLGCLQDLTAQVDENPAGRNPPKKSPTMVIKAIEGALPTPAHGPPKGKPRTIN